MKIEEYKPQIEAFLAHAMPASDDAKNVLTEAMRYSLLAGGKRLRPILALEFCRICGGDVEAALPAACALEMIHTYSLIHDDLPCMDNDDLRRGKPTNHVVFGECTATLAGDALQPLAFSTILSSSLPADRKAECARILADAAGPYGMCRGQTLDMLGEGKILSEKELTEINVLKTGALLAGACMLGCAAAGAENGLVLHACDFGYKLGLAFQIRDDMLDVLSSTEELGKPVGSDAEEQKNTYMAILGEEECARRVQQLTDEAVAILKANFRDTGALEELAQAMVTRRK